MALMSPKIINIVSYQILRKIREHNATCQMSPRCTWSWSSEGRPLIYNSSEAGNTTGHLTRFSILFPVPGLHAEDERGFWGKPHQTIGWGFRFYISSESKIRSYRIGTAVKIYNDTLVVRKLIQSLTLHSLFFT